MFSFRRKPSQPETPRIRTSPSLPTLSSPGVAWPENLVDVDAIRQDIPTDVPAQGAAKTSLQGPERTAIPFHKPFRGSPGKPGDGPISSLYMTGQTPAFDNRKSTAPTVSRYSQRRAKVPPTFNLMVCHTLWTFNLYPFFVPRSLVAKALGKPHSFVCFWRRRMYLRLPRSTSGRRYSASYEDLLKQLNLSTPPALRFASLALTESSSPAG